MKEAGYRDSRLWLNKFLSEIDNWGKKELEERFETILNYRIEVEERSNSVVFLRKIVRGGADKSYGIEVARLAGLPKEILLNSKKILNRTVILLYINRNTVINGQKHKN